MDLEEEFCQLGSQNGKGMEQLGFLRCRGRCVVVEI